MVLSGCLLCSPYLTKIVLTRLQIFQTFFKCCKKTGYNTYDYGWFTEVTGKNEKFKMKNEKRVSLHFNMAFNWLAKNVSCPF